MLLWATFISGAVFVVFECGDGSLEMGSYIISPLAYPHVVDLSLCEHSDTAGRLRKVCPAKRKAQTRAGISTGPIASLHYLNDASLVS